METDAEMPMWAVDNFRQLYSMEIKQLIDSRQYMYAYCIIISPAEEMRRNREQLMLKFHYAFTLATTAYALAKTLESYVQNPSSTSEEKIKQVQGLFERAMAQSKLPKIHTPLEKKILNDS